MKTETPIIDFAPKAIQTIVKCQTILAEHTAPNSGISEKDCIGNLLEVLNNQDLVKQLNEVLGKTTSNNGIIEIKPSENLFYGPGDGICFTKNCIYETKSKELNEETEVISDDKGLPHVLGDLYKFFQIVS